MWMHMLTGEEMRRQVIRKRLKRYKRKEVDEATS